MKPLISLFTLAGFCLASFLGLFTVGCLAGVMWHILQAGFRAAAHLLN